MKIDEDETAGMPGPKIVGLDGPLGVDGDDLPTRLKIASGSASSIRPPMLSFISIQPDQMIFSATKAARSESSQTQPVNGTSSRPTTTPRMS